MLLALTLRETTDAFTYLAFTLPVAPVTTLWNSIFTLNVFQDSVSRVRDIVAASYGLYAFFTVLGSDYDDGYFTKFVERVVEKISTIS